MMFLQRKKIQKPISQQTKNLMLRIRQPRKIFSQSCLSVGCQGDLALARKNSLHSSSRANKLRLFTLTLRATQGNVTIPDLKSRIRAVAGAHMLTIHVSCRLLKKRYCEPLCTTCKASTTGGCMRGSSTLLSTLCCIELIQVC